MFHRETFEKYYDIGTFSKLTNSYCLLALGDAKSFHDCCENALHGTLPVIYTSIADCRVIGCLTAGNSKGLLVPSNTTELELKRLREYLPHSVKLCCLNESLSALGNVIACNDYVALIHPQLERETEEIIGDVLGVEVFRQTIADEPLVGAHIVMNNQGGLVHPNSSQDEQDDLSSLTQIRIAAGSVNDGSPYISAGMIVNDWMTVVGARTGYQEAELINSVLKQNQVYYDSEQDVYKARQTILRDIL